MYSTPHQIPLPNCAGVLGIRGVNCALTIRVLAVRHKHHTAHVLQQTSRIEQPDKSVNDHSVLKARALASVPRYIARS